MGNNKSQTLTPSSTRTTKFGKHRNSELKLLVGSEEKYIY